MYETVDFENLPLMIGRNKNYQDHPRGPRGVKWTHSTLYSNRLSFGTDWMLLVETTNICDRKDVSSKTHKMIDPSSWSIDPMFDLR